MLVAVAEQAREVRWSLQPTLVVTCSVVLLLVGFWLGRSSYDLHRWWLDLWGIISYWIGRLVSVAAVVGLLWLLVWWWRGQHG